MLRITGKLMPEASRSLGHQFTCDLWHSLFPPEVSILFFLIPFAESNIFVKTSGRKYLFSAGVWGKTLFFMLQKKLFFKWVIIFHYLPISWHLNVPRRMGFEGVLLKQHLVKTGPKKGLLFLPMHIPFWQYLDVTFESKSNIQRNIGFNFPFKYIAWEK